MKNQLLHTVEGLRDIHPLETGKKNIIERTILSLFECYGYEQVQTPTFEYFDIYHNKRGTDNEKNLYKFFNREGDILALRPDVTPSIARYMATFYNHQNAPGRFSYRGNVFYNNENYQGKLREYTQVGVECIGVGSAEADAEIIALAVNSLLAVGLEQFQIDVGHVGFFNGLVEMAGLDSEMQEELRLLIDEKNYIGLEELLVEHDIDGTAKQGLIDLPKLFGDVTILEKAKAFALNDKTKKAIVRLKEVYELLDVYGVSDYVSFDLGTVSKLDYYTGVIFKGYTYDVGDSIVDGGRYNNLLGTFSYDVPAVGFAVKTDELLNALTRQNIDIEVERTNTLIIYNEKLVTTAIKLAESLRKTGMSVELGVGHMSEDEINKYGKAKGIGGIMTLIDTDSIKLLNLSTEEESEIKISDLVEGGL